MLRIETTTNDVSFFKPTANFKNHREGPAPAKAGVEHRDSLPTRGLIVPIPNDFNAQFAKPAAGVGMLTAGCLRFGKLRFT